MQKFLDKLAGCRRSLVIWFNGAALAALPVFDYAKENFHQVQDYLDGNIYRTVGLIIVAGNIILRFRTTESLESKK